MPCNRCSPPPRITGLTARCISSTSPACRYWRMTLAPPPRRMSLPCADAFARSSAAWMPSVTKWNVVPRLARVMRQHVDVGVIGRIIAPPAFPCVVRPLAADRAEHVAPHDPGADVLEPAHGEVVVRPFTAALLAEPLLEGLGRKHPFVQRLATFAERTIEALARPRAVAVERDAVRGDAQLSHGAAHNCGMGRHSMISTESPGKIAKCG